MDDLSSLDWNARSAGAAPPIRNTFSPPITSGSRATPTTSNLTPQPFSRPASSLSGTPQPPVKAISPANDSFSNLLSLNSGKGQSNVSLQDRQRQLLAEKSRQVEEQRKRHEREAQQWENLGRGNTPVNGQSTHVAPAEDEDDILAAVKSTAQVDRSSHFPPPASTQASARSTPVIKYTNVIASQGPNNGTFDEDDDPFGLGSFPSRSMPKASQPVHDMEDDILGDLGKPVQPKPEPETKSEVGLRETVPPVTANTGPLDRAIAELVDMGFPVEKATQALQATDGNLQAAVSWLLNQAHEDSRQKTRSPTRDRSSHTQPSTARRTQAAADPAVPAWMRQESRPDSEQRRQDSRSPTNEKDVTQYATEIGSTLFKSANSLWRTGQKRMQKAVAEFQQHEGGDPNQPKWMRDVSADAARPAARLQREQPELTTREQQRNSAQSQTVTDEALLLESGAARSQRPTRSTPTAVDPRRLVSDEAPSRGRSPAHDLPERPASQPRFTPQTQQQARPPTKLSRQAVEEEASQAYVSSSRRRRPAPKTEPEPPVDLFSPAPETKPAPQVSARPPQANGTHNNIPKTSSTRSTPQPPRPKAPSRMIPSVSPSALATSSQHRKAGTEAYKRGDYAAAHESYSAALRPLPPTHPLMIVVLSNRALTAIKTGDPKMAISDADQAIAIVGISKGEGETIDFGAGEGIKDMKDFYGKALMRKAEALENMEKWSDAAAVWREAVQSGVGGSVSLQGRDRCEKAATGGAAKAVASKPKPATTMRRPAPVKAVVSNAASAEAVKSLRAANAAAEKADDEKFQLADVVSARIDAWKGGKSDNLRALLGSLDTVLWPEAGWKKVGMSDLVIPGRVKIIYMKAIAKVHPDKVRTILRCGKGRAMLTRYRYLKMLLRNRGWSVERFSVPSTRLGISSRRTMACRQAWR